MGAILATAAASVYKCGMAEPPISLEAVGRVLSSLRSLAEAPKQGDEGAPEAIIEVDPRFAAAAADIRTGDELLLLTWLDRAERGVQAVHPRDDPSRPLTGVFSTRSPARPNPVGLHRVRVLAVDGPRISVGGLEALDGTPVLDIKPLLGDER
jgi:tRNA-Thr(GGU) m(6)t(6)A37 methyltransferase TsaA